MGATHPGSIWAHLLLLWVALFVAGCSEEGGQAAERPAFAVEGSVETTYQIHLYRVTLPPESGKGLIMQFHPRAGSRFRFQDDVRPPVDDLLICDQDVGFKLSDRRRGECRKISIGDDFAVPGDAHVAVEVLAPGSDPIVIPELVVGYDPGDAFLGIEFPD